MQKAPERALPTAWKDIDSGSLVGFLPAEPTWTQRLERF
jgi:hypothetical protein